MKGIELELIGDAMSYPSDALKEKKRRLSFKAGEGLTVRVSIGGTERLMSEFVERFKLSAKHRCIKLILDESQTNLAEHEAKK